MPGSTNLRKACWGSILVTTALLARICCPSASSTPLASPSSTMNLATGELVSTFPPWASIYLAIALGSSMLPPSGIDSP